MVKSEELFGTTEYLTLLTRYRINWYRYKRVRLYFYRKLHHFCCKVVDLLLEWLTSCGSVSAPYIIAIVPLCCRQGYTNFPKIWEPAQNSRRSKVNTKQGAH